MSENAVVPFGIRMRLFGWGLGLGLAVGGVGAGKLWWDARGERITAAEACDDRVASTRDELLARQEELDVARGRVRLYEARSLVQRADAQLAAGNFGLAADHASAAFKSVELVGSDPTGLNRDRVAAARQALDGLAIAPTADVAGERSRLASVITLIDAALAP